MMGTRSNLAAGVYHQDTKCPGAGELSPLPAHGSDCWLEKCSFFISLTKYYFLQRLGASPNVTAGRKGHERSVLMLFQKDVEPPCVQGGFSRRPKIFAQFCIGQTLVWWLRFERHLQSFPDGLFKEGFLLQRRVKPFCEL